MSAISILALAASLARAQMTMTAGVTQLHDAFVESTEDERRGQLIEALSRTPAATPKDVESLFDLFVRFPDTRVREAVLSSLQRTDPRNPSMEPLFVRYLTEPDPEAVLFGIKGALQVRASDALPIIEKLARRSFAFPSPTDTSIISERNIWWTQYEALSALAQWQGDKALPLIKKKAKEAPRVARILAMFYWKESLPLFEKWAASGGADNRERTKQALETPVPAPILRDCRSEMLARVRDRKAPRELRHQLAIKVGVTSTEPEVSDLLKEYDAGTDPDTQLMLSAALFASRSRQVVPLLLRHAKEHKDPRTRAGARLQLRDMLGPAEYRSLVEWTAASDPDADNRSDAATELRTLAR